MAGPMQGVKVVEIGMWVAGPPLLGEHTDEVLGELDRTGSNGRERT